ncbi:MAG: molybdopterin-binding protein [Proteobacteria bacterium]|nr:molybdopterin-binding protein [Pseudomonadota bacterium]
MGSRTVTACVLIIGNEILSGRTQDINLNHIALTLGAWGIRIREARVIPDIESTIINTLNEVRRTFDYVFTTGGIGPTHDDITADCIAAAFGVPIVVNADIAARITSRPAPEDIMTSRLRMARVPQGSTLIDNPTGGPQGFCIENVYVMAGIPMVMQAMLSTLEGKLEHGDVVRSRSVTVYVGESQIAAHLTDIQQAYPHIDLGSYPFFRDERYGTSLVMRGTVESELDEMLQRVIAAIVEVGSTPENISRG